MSHHASAPPLKAPSIAITADAPLTTPSNGEMVDSPYKMSGDHMKPLSLPTNPAEKTLTSQYSQDSQTRRSPRSFMENTTKMGDKQETVPEKRNYTTDLKLEQRAEAPAAAVSTRTTAVSASHTSHVRRALFTNRASHAPVRRTKSEGHVLVAVASAEQSTVPEVCTDATMNDRLWRKLEPSSHRDSMSSSSSISSSDTVIDLSLPNLARKSLTSLPTASSTCTSPWVNCRHSALLSYDTLLISKSKSNPNLQQSQSPPEDELHPRPLQESQEAPLDSPNRLTQRRHTWSRLYMEGLKQSSSTRRSSSAATTPTATAASTTMSKSLGDLTSDDISCNFDSKYRSISRSFIVRPTREQLRRGSPHRSRPPSDLTEQLRRLTDVEPLSASDFVQDNKQRASQEEEEPVDESLVRRTSSRSQSRVRYIANRAKKAQERQRLQSLAQGRSASFSHAGGIGTDNYASPIEERGNPEGACCVARSPCTSLDLLSQLAPPESPSPRQSQSSPDPENSEVFFMLKL